MPKYMPYYIEDREKHRFNKEVGRDSGSYEAYHLQKTPKTSGLFCGFFILSKL